MDVSIISACDFFDADRRTKEKMELPPLWPDASGVGAGVLAAVATALPGTGDDGIPVMGTNPPPFAAPAAALCCECGGGCCCC